MLINKDYLAKAYEICLPVVFILTLVFLKPALATQPEQQFKVGLVLPLTGQAADFGVAIKNSIELAINDNPRSFTNIKFVYEDAAYDPKTAISALNKLIDGERVNLTVTWGVSFCKALAPIAEARKIPLVGICLDPTIAANKRYVIRFKNTTDEIMQAQARYLYNHGLKRIALLLAEHPYLEEVTQALKRNLVPGQNLILIDQIPVSEMDLRTQVIKIKNRRSEFDVIGVFLSAGQIATFYQRASELKLEVPSFGTDWFESLSEVRASRGSMNGALFASIDIKQAFLKRYRDFFKNESQLAFGAPAYEFAVTVGELFNSVNTDLLADEIIARFSTIKSKDGFASGPYKYVNDSQAGQYFQFPVVVKKIVNDKFEVIH